MPTKNSKQVAIAQRRQQVANFHIQGWPQVEIAHKLGVAQGTISTDLQCIQKEWRESAVRDFDEARMIELKKLDRIERESWEAWERSQKPSQAAEMDGSNSVPTRKRIKNQYGDPRFLDQIQKCIAARHALLGLDAPTKIAPVEPDGLEPYRLAVEDLTITELQLLMHLGSRMPACPAISGADPDVQTDES